MLPYPARRSTQGIALISTLAIIAIVTIMLVSFVSVVNQDRSATQNYSQGLRADQVARGGLDSIVDLLRQEITDPALNDYTNAPNTSYTLYAVTNPANATNIFPQHNGPAGFPTIIGYSGTNIYQTVATNVATTVVTNTVDTPSLNGRAISISRWNQSYMVTSTNDFPAVQWTLVTRAGVGTSAPTIDVARNNALSNDQFVVGRYAYIVYDTSGLLDANVAGSLDNPATPSGIKGLLPWADLSQIGISYGDMQKLVKWRNPTTSTDSNTYDTYVTNQWVTNGFMRVASGDNAFLSRQDLIHYVTSQNAGLTAALPYLTTFSRAINSPTWGPRVNGTGAGYQYLANQLAGNSVNPLIFNTRVASNKGFVRNSGATAHPGEPLVLNRFPLSKLALLEAASGPIPANAGAIAQYFGLDMVSDSNGVYRHWSYPTANPSYAHNSGVILTLDQVAAKGREPDFFELLKAGIYSGSLGMAGRGDSLLTQWGSVDPDADFLRNSGWKWSGEDGQIIQIGANIIDQWDSDDYPTRIGFNGYDFYGVEDLPFIEQMFFNIDDGGDPTTAATKLFNLYFSLWNPHQPRRPGAPQAPTYNIRVNIGSRPEGGYSFTFGLKPSQTTFPAWAVDAWTPPRNIIFYNDIGRFGGAGYFGFGYSSASGAYRADALLKGATASGNANTYMNSAGDRVTQTMSYSASSLDAYQLNFTHTYNAPAEAMVSSASGATLNTTDTKPPLNWCYYMTINLLMADMEIQDPAHPTIYYPYSAFAGYYETNAPTSSGVISTDYSAGGGGPGTFPYECAAVNYENTAGGVYPNLCLPVVAPSTTPGKDYNMIKSDPRTRRWGGYYSTGMLDTSGNYTIPDYYLPTSNASSVGFGPAKSQRTSYDIIKGWQTNTNAPTSGSSPGYYDNDGIQRPADNANISPVNLTDSASYGDGHGIILNRPFTSVAELGYVFRDNPWRSLDFSSAKSADAGLLDLFTMEDAPVVAGQVNPNTPYPQVLAALLSGSFGAPGVNTPVISQANALTIADTITAQLSNNPVMNRGDLPTSIATNLGLTAKMGGTQTKAQREAVVRALADISNTRTWNIMIDIIAQSGRYPTTAKTLDNFNVTGERRYWLHVAIDRYTGQIVDEMLEKVGD